MQDDEKFAVYFAIIALAVPGWHQVRTPTGMKMAVEDRCILGPRIP